MLLGRYMHLRHGKEHRAEGILDRSAYILLSRIRVQGPMSIGQLGEAFGLDVSTLNRQTAAAARAGLVERIPDPDGGLARKFRITEEGARRLDQDRARVIAGLDRIMADWPEERIAAFADHLQHFNASLEQLHGLPWPRQGEPRAGA
ncbi:MarR family winged helix-turn-helix transcriptional regulator [Streptomyces sp. QL37]|uniref:MarR family winged helix-turn-helix transcriptional regulator n=1 Tax=Streptomyces sp. QL37 TaxID=2093747 RepID=UPI000CF27727|nr:MarR family transcriptional regulator [Streptomyces sp. QL37]PPQ62223.1 MarR family transcriptional regulator [Streptomyces sp. QL37]